jgi:threonine dehydratase
VQLQKDDMMQFDDIILAQERLSAHLTPTHLEPAILLDGPIYFKLENTNLTHSFKIRGALNAVLSLDAPQRGLVTASSGNHAQGLAIAAQMVGARARILMPAHTPRRKVAAARHYGAQVVLDHETYDDCEAVALDMARDEGLTYVSAYNDPQVIAGAGTIGLEILAQMPDVARVVVCVGGGGLISGIALAIKARRPDVTVIGVNAKAAPTMHNLLYGTDYPEVWETLAEALSGGIEDGALTIDLTKRYVDQLVMVDEDQIAAAMRWMLDHQGWLVEGGGAVSVAALLHGVIPVDDRPTVALVSGGNVDPTTIRQIICEADHHATDL